MAGNMFISAQDVEANLTWREVVDAIDEGHAAQRARVDDLVLARGDRSLLNRGAWIPGLGIGLKTVTVFPDNPGRTPARPTVQGVFVAFDSDTGAVRAVIQGDAITDWKTAADSVLGARYLARPDSSGLLVLGAGRVARNLVTAYRAIFPGLGRIAIWNRSPAKAAALAEALAAEGHPATATSDLAAALASADIVASATASPAPVIDGHALKPGTHVDLIGAYRADMREADDTVLRRGELFVDSRETTLHHIGDLKIPLEQGVIRESDVRGDLYDLRAGHAGRSGADAITVFKNGGGAHLDLMVADLIVRNLCAG